MLSGQGRGGLSRGPGPAGLDFSHERSDVSERFTPEQLPTARFLDLERSGLVGLGQRAPEVNPEQDSAGTSGDVEAGSGSSWRRRLAPRHRRAVQRFFRPDDSR